MTRKQGRYVTPSKFDKNKLSLSAPEKSGRVFRVVVMYAYTDDSSGGQIVEPLTVSSGCEVECPSGTYPDVFREEGEPDILTGRTATHVRLSSSIEEHSNFYGVLDLVYEFLKNKNKDNDVKMPMSYFELGDDDYVNLHLGFVESKDKKIFTKMRDKSGKDVTLPLSPCNVTIGFGIGYPVSEKKRINVRFSLKQMIIGDPIVGGGGITIDDESLDG